VPLTALLISCGGGNNDKPNTGIPDKGEWHNCQLPEGFLQGAQCTLQEVPLDWSKPEGRKIEVAVIRYLSNAANKTGDIWLLDGGPGLWGVSYATDWANRFINDRDTYIPTLRGTGASSFLQCSTKLSEDPQQCFDELFQQYGDELSQFNTHNAAQDIGFLIDKFSAETNDVVLYGTSFGGYLAQRYLQYYPAQVDAVVIDSAVHLKSPFHLQPYTGNEVGYIMLDYCEQDEWCKDKLGGNPRQFFEETYVGLQQGSCPVFGDGPEQFKVDYIKDLFYSLLEERRYSLFPALISRLNRCNESDQALFENVGEAMLNGGLNIVEDWEGGEYEKPVGYDWRGLKDANTLLATTIEVSEIFQPTRTKEQVLALNENLRFGSVSGDIFDLDDIWQVPKVPVNNEPAQTDIPILILHTEMDEGVVLDEGKKIARDFNGENQHFVIVPRVSHAIGLWAWHSCPEKILTTFLNDHDAVPDRSCLAQMPAIDFTLESDWGKELSQEIFGLDNLWFDD